tara:strand:- start:346 stop:573 length:228 start_codon:yes stop_codon:yes gene_type:complete
MVKLALGKANMGKDIMIAVVGGKRFFLFGKRKQLSKVRSIPKHRHDLIARQVGIWNREYGIKVNIKALLAVIISK